MMKKILCGALILLLMLSLLGAYAREVDDSAIHQPGEFVEDAATALRLLKDGNVRYLTGEMQPKDRYAEDREVLASGQKPFAAILTCADSRIAPEICFDQRLGDLFTVRNAGNIADTTAIGSIEYAVEHLKSPLVVIVGHSKCSAVTAAFEGHEASPALTSILNAIRPACDHAKDVDEAIYRNIQNMVKAVSDNAVIMESGALVIGAHYDIATGEITWLDDALAELDDAA